MSLEDEIRRIVREELAATAPRLTAKALRVKAGLTQPQLAERAGVGAATISRLEAGKTKNIQPETVRKIGKALGCSYFAEVACK